MLDHLSISVKNYHESRKFYDGSLAILGIELIMNFEDESQNVAGYGSFGKPYFWIGQTDDTDPEEHIGKAQGMHFAFEAPSVEAIKTWHTKCLELGGKCNGAPGPRPEYHDNYYAAYIIDPNGWRIEAVTHQYVADE